MKKKEDKIPLRDGDEEVQAADKEKIVSATQSRDAAVTDAQKLKAVEDLEAAKEAAKAVSTCCDTLRV